MAGVWKRSLWTFFGKQEMLLARARQLLEASQFALSGDLSSPLISDTIDTMAKDLDDYRGVLADKFEELKKNFQELKKSSQDVHYELRGISTSLVPLGDISVNVRAAHDGVKELTSIQRSIARDQIRIQTNAGNTVRKIEESMTQDRRYDGDVFTASLHERETSIFDPSGICHQVSVTPEGVVSAFDAEVHGQLAVVHYYRSRRELHTMVNPLKPLRQACPRSSRSPLAQNALRCKATLASSINFGDIRTPEALKILRCCTVHPSLLIDNWGVPKLDCQDTRHYTDPLNPEWYAKKLASIQNFFSENGREFSSIADSVHLPACTVLTQRSLVHDLTQCLVDVDDENYQQLSEMKVDAILRAWSKIIPVLRYNNINDLLQPRVGTVGWFDWSLAQRVCVAADHNIPEDVSSVEHLDWHLSWTSMEAEIGDLRDRSTTYILEFGPDDHEGGVRLDFQNINRGSSLAAWAEWFLLNSLEIPKDCEVPLSSELDDVPRFLYSFTAERALGELFPCTSEVISASIVEYLALNDLEARLSVTCSRWLKPNALQRTKV
ncbi:hypothetical protein B0H13DRAFT_1886383 [Mycena leptocephala]|nr:hypothetical protein B0H13DRAFT_1886383 [Mycena leptocephala]